MERIYLSKHEKQVLRWLRSHNGYKATMPRASFDRALRLLQEKGLAVGFWSEEEGLVEAFLTPGGEGYIEDNPTLCNPIDWKWVITTIVASVAAIASIAALFVACKSYK